MGAKLVTAPDGDPFAFFQLQVGHYRIVGSGASGHTPADGFNAIIDAQFRHLYGLHLATEKELSDFLKQAEKKAFKRTYYNVRDEDAALDILQDSMIKLATHYGDKPADELPLLFQRILSNTTLDWFRRQKTRNAHFTTLSDFSATDASDDFDLLVLDLSMPGRRGLELLKQVRELRPRLPILIFSMHPEEQFAVRALRAGANGYLSKEGDSDLILPALRKVAAGGMFISNKVAELLATDAMPHHQALPHTTLSDREFDVFHRILRGTSLTDIAHELNLSIKTVSTHKSHIFSKLGISTQVELIRYAMAHGLADGLPE